MIEETDNLYYDNFITNLRAKSDLIRIFFSILRPD